MKILVGQIEGVKKMQKKGGVLPFFIIKNRQIFTQKMHLA